jgi:hypothetical protein
LGYFLINKLIVLFYNKKFKFISFNFVFTKINKNSNKIKDFIYYNRNGLSFLYKKILKLNQKPLFFKKNFFLTFLRKSVFFTKNKLPRLRQICKNMVLFTLSLNIFSILKTNEIYYSFFLKNNFSLCFLIFILSLCVFVRSIFKDKKL